MDIIDRIKNNIIKIGVVSVFFLIVVAYIISGDSDGKDSKDTKDAKDAKDAKAVNDAKAVKTKAEEALKAAKEVIAAATETTGKEKAEEALKAATKALADANKALTAANDAKGKSDNAKTIAATTALTSANNSMTAATTALTTATKVVISNSLTRAKDAKTKAEGVMKTAKAVVDATKKKASMDAATAALNAANKALTNATSAKGKADKAKTIADATAALTDANTAKKALTVANTAMKTSTAVLNKANQLCNSIDNSLWTPVKRPTKEAITPIPTKDICKQNFKLNPSIKSITCDTQGNIITVDNNDKNIKVSNICQTSGGTKPSSSNTPVTCDLNTLTTGTTLANKKLLYPGGSMGINSGIMIKDVTCNTNTHTKNPQGKLSCSKDGKITNTVCIPKKKTCLPPLNSSSDAIPGDPTKKNNFLKVENVKCKTGYKKNSEVTGKKITCNDGKTSFDTGVTISNICQPIPCSPGVNANYTLLKKYNASSRVGKTTKIPYSDIGCKNPKIKNTVFNQKAYKCDSSGKIINVPNEICISKDSCGNITNGSWKKEKGKVVIPKKTDTLSLDDFSCNTGYHQDISLFFHDGNSKIKCTPGILTKLCYKTPNYDTGNRKAKKYVDAVYKDLDSVCKVDPKTGYFINKNKKNEYDCTSCLGTLSKYIKTDPMLLKAWINGGTPYRGAPSGYVRSPWTPFEKYHIYTKIKNPLGCNIPINREPLSIPTPRDLVTCPTPSNGNWIGNHKVGDKISIIRETVKCNKGYAPLSRLKYGDDHGSHIISCNDVGNKNEPICVNISKCQAKAKINKQIDYIINNNTDKQYIQCNKGFLPNQTLFNGNQPVVCSYDKANYIKGKIPYAGPPANIKGQDLCVEYKCSPPKNGSWNKPGNDYNGEVWPGQPYIQEKQYTYNSKTNKFYSCTNEFVPNPGIKTFTCMADGTLDESKQPLCINKKTAQSINTNTCGSTQSVTQVTYKGSTQNINEYKCLSGYDKNLLYRDYVCKNDEIVPKERYSIFFRKKYLGLDVKFKNGTGVSTIGNYPKKFGDTKTMNNWVGTFNTSKEPIIPCYKQKPILTKTDAEDIEKAIQKCWHPLKDGFGIFGQLREEINNRYKTKNKNTMRNDMKKSNSRIPLLITSDMFLIDLYNIIKDKLDLFKNYDIKEWAKLKNNVIEPAAKTIMETNKYILTYTIIQCSKNVDNNNGLPVNLRGFAERLRKGDGIVVSSGKGTTGTTGTTGYTVTSGISGKYTSQKYEETYNKCCRKEITTGRQYAKLINNDTIPYGCILNKENGTSLWFNTTRTDKTTKPTILRSQFSNKDYKVINVDNCIKTKLDAEK